MMTAIDASGNRAKHAMMARIVTCDATNRGALEAALGVGSRGGERETGDGKQCDDGSHDSDPCLTGDVDASHRING
jgi:hypothetical protein